MDKEFISLDKEFVNSYKDKKVPWGFNGLGYIVYKRTYARLIPELNRTEEWHETIERCINGAQKIGARYTKDEAEKLFDLIFNLKCNFAGRMLWQLGTGTVDKIGMPSLLNCWWVSIRKPEDFCFVFDHLMLGGGVGFSVKKEDVHELPKVKSNISITHERTKDSDFIIPDSRQGWVELLRKVLDSYFVTGKSFSYSTILIREAGELIKTFGGKASGYRILVDGINNITKVLDSREGKKLRSTDVLDICNIIGSIVVAGNIRRSAEIAIGDPDDYLYARAKRWDLGNIPNWRSMSNNSISADSFDQISNDIWNGYDGNGEPYGLINLKLARTYGRLGEKIKDDVEGFNPCFTADTPLLTENGFVNIGDLKDQKMILLNYRGEKVNGKVWSNGIKDIVTLKFSNKEEIKCTPDHRFMLLDGSECEAKDLKGRRINLYLGNQIEHNSEYVKYGFIQGDGGLGRLSSSDHLGLEINIGKNDLDVANFFGIEYRDDVRSYYTTGFNEKLRQLGFSSQSLPTREFPTSYDYWDENDKLSFLKGMFSANGSVVKKHRVSYKAVSKKLIDKLSETLFDFGINNYITVNKAKTVSFANGDYTCKESYDVNISDFESIRLFYKKIGFIHLYKMENLKSLLFLKSPVVISVKDSGSEEVFDFNLDDDTHWGVVGSGFVAHNCAEATLGDKEPCDLAELYLNNIVSKDEMFDCAKLLYKTTKAVLTLPAIYQETEKIVRKNMRIGIGITGICQSLDKLEWCDSVYKELRKYDIEWSKERGWNKSIKMTLIKPSGTLSLLAGSTPGVHPGYSKYYIRRVRIASNDSLISICREAGYKMEYQRNFDGTENHDTMVVEFPCKAGDNSIVAKDMSAIRQLDLVKKMQTIWADQAVSVTVYYKKEELPEIKNWLKENYEKSIKSVSFLLHNEHGFDQAPYEEITEEIYNSLKSKITELNIISASDMIEGLECEGGACPVR